MPRQHYSTPVGKERLEGTGTSSEHHQGLEPLKYTNSPGSDSETSKRTNSTVAMDDEGNSVEHEYQGEYQALENISLAETTSEQNDDDELFEDTGPNRILAERETRAVTWLRVAVSTGLALAAVIVSAGVFFSRTYAQEKDFNSAFLEASVKVVDSFQSTWKLRWQAVESLAIDLTSFAEHAGNSSGFWPTITFPDFPRRAHSTLGLAHASSVAIVPLVQDADRDAWQSYAVLHARDWLNGHDETPSPTLRRRTLLPDLFAPGINDHIFNFDGTAREGTGPYAPVWQTHPVTNNLVSWVNMDLFQAKRMNGLHRSLETKTALLDQVANTQPDSSHEPDNQNWPLLAQALRGKPDSSYATEPFSLMYYPLLHGNGEKSDVVGFLLSAVYWRFCFENVLPSSITGVVVVVHNKCEQAFTYSVDGKQAKFWGYGDLHDKSYDHMAKTVNLTKDQTSQHDASFLNMVFDQDYCSYSMSVYPSHQLRKKFVTNGPILSTILVIFVVSFACVVFFLYDYLMERRQKVVMDQAMQSTAIVSSLFPEAVRNRLFNGGEDHEVVESDHRGARPSITSAEGNGDVENSPDSNGYGYNVPSMMCFEPAAKTQLKSFLNNDESADGVTVGGNKPIADLFPHCTVLFADIAGFTAWSSLRDPAQVFTLLENIYHSFDHIARKRGVFKVETVGDSYVAVTGLPDPQDDHAIVMAKFARDCRLKMNEVTRKLELTLGPDTGDLSMRFGLHSGPVTAGVLRGERSRFQLFGDTVNTAARMESTGERDKIQCSQSTADILTAEGKGHWLRAREKKVHAKGKGEMQTYFIEMKQSSARDERRNSDHSQLSGDYVPERSVIWGSEEEIPESVTQRAKHQRLIDYNVDLLMHHLRRIVARRNALIMAGRRCSQGGLAPVLHEPSTETKDHMVLDEVAEVIRLPQYDATLVKGYVDPDTIELPSNVVSQLKRYVSVIAAMYRQNPFHNFEHASHVVMSVNKLLQRVTTPSIDVSDSQNAASELHNYTYGITSDAITQFSVVFAAMIHDVDHWGVSNQQLTEEKAPMAAKYNHKSIAEQNSVDLAWDLLMDVDEYGDLQRCIFSTDAEYRRFRQVVVNLVMATDIFDKELGELRKKRWDKAFAKDKENVIDPDEDHRKATIVIEHIMQASDVAHTMQHWHVYQKWNRRLFDELYTAWRAGRMEVDPSTFWYNGEIKFFDTYIIPLAKKLKECGVFGVASDECLNYAMDNRKEWEAKGEMIVKELISNYEQRDREEAQRVAAAKEDGGADGPTGGRHSKKKAARFSRRRSLITTGG